MKKTLLTIAAFLLVGIATLNAQNTSSVSVSKDGKTFTATKQAKNTTGKGYTPTGFTYIDTDGNAYEIHVHTTQRGEHAGETKCYIQRTSKKTGKPYWKEIPVKPEELKED